MPSKANTFIDAFCGAGGMSLGLEAAGFNPLVGFDADPVCIETCKLNQRFLRGNFYLSKIEDLLGGNILKLAGIVPGELGLLAGGPPCQGFSNQRIGPDNDPRNDLVIAYSELVKELMPRSFILENVPGLGGKRGIQRFTKLISDLEKTGYAIASDTLDAANYGVPQRRKRVIVVGTRLDIKVNFTFSQPTLKKITTVRQTIGHLPPAPIDGSEHPEYNHHRADRLSPNNLQRIQALKPGQGMQDLPEELRAECHKKGPSKIGHRYVYGRMEWDNVAPTITARFDSFTRGKFGHPEQPRSISLLEGALLQTFPPGFKFTGTKVEIARQIGNAVPPVFSKAIGKMIKKFVC